MSGTLAGIDSSEFSEYSRVAAPIYRTLTNVAESDIGIEVRNLQELYTLVFGAAGVEKLSALRMAKLVAITGKAFHVQVENNRTPYFTTIWLYGVEPVKDTQVLRKHSILAKAWAEGATPAYRYIRCYNPVGLSRTMDRFPSGIVDQLASVISSTATLSDNQLISIAFDFLVGRPFVNGRQNLLTPGEALSELSIQTLLKNAWEVGRYIQKRPIEPCALSLDGVVPGSDSWRVDQAQETTVLCLKNGSMNPLVVYLACLALETLGIGIGRGSQNLWRVLSCRMLSAELEYRYRLREASVATKRSKLELESRILREGERGVPSGMSQFSWNRVCRLYRDVAALAAETARNTSPILMQVSKLGDAIRSRGDSWAVGGLPSDLEGRLGTEWYGAFLRQAKTIVKSLDSLRDSFRLDPGIGYLTGEAIPAAYSGSVHSTADPPTASDWDRWTASW